MGCPWPLKPAAIAQLCFTASRSCLLRLYLGLHNDRVPALHFNVQVMSIEQQHTHEWGAAGRVGLDMSRLAVPEHNHIVDIEAHNVIVCQERPAHVSKQQARVSNHGGWQRQGASVAGVDNGLDVPRSTVRALQGKDHQRFIGSIHGPYSHSRLRKGPAPKLRSAR